MENNNYLFPGRWLGGLTMIFGPILILTGVVLRFKFNFFFPDQLEAYREFPTLITISYSAFLAGNILMWPAILALINQLYNKSQQFAFWGGLLVILGFSLALSTLVLTIWHFK